MDAENGDAGNVVPTTIHHSPFTIHRLPLPLSITIASETNELAGIRIAAARGLIFPERQKTRVLAL